MLTDTEKEHNSLINCYIIELLLVYLTITGIQLAVLGLFLVYLYPVIATVFRESIIYHTEKISLSAMLCNSDLGCYFWLTKMTLFIKF